MKTQNSLQRARTAMSEAGVDAVLVASPGLVAFLSGHIMPPHLIYPSRDGRLEKATLVLASHTGLATVGTNPCPTDGLAIDYADGRAGLTDAPEAFAALVQAVEAIELDGASSIAVELAAVPASACAALESAVPRATITPLDGLFKHAKAVKDDSEIEGIREACRLVDAAQAAVLAAIKPGVSELELYGVVSMALNEAAAGVALPLSEIQVGARTAIAMGPATGRRVQQGDLVMCDIAPRHPNGWWSDLCTTGVCGEPSAEQRSAWPRLNDALRAGQNALRPGATAGEVYAAIAACAGEQPGHAGHGVGRDHYEEPVLRPGSREPILENTVIAIEPGCYRDTWGMRIEWLYRVTPSGGEPLTTFRLALTD